MLLIQRNNDKKIFPNIHVHFDFPTNSYIDIDIKYSLYNSIKKINKKMIKVDMVGEKLKILKQTRILHEIYSIIPQKMPNPQTQQTNH